jgi:hypothetical protein
MLRTENRERGSETTYGLLFGGKRRAICVKIHEHRSQAYRRNPFTSRSPLAVQLKERDYKRRGCQQTLAIFAVTILWTFRCLVAPPSYRTAQFATLRLIDDVIYAHGRSHTAL